MKSVQRKPVMGVGGDDYWAGVQSRRRDHPEPGSWATSEFLRGWRDCKVFSSPIRGGDDR